jgi:Tol biopolymer transport system component
VVDFACYDTSWSHDGKRLMLQSAAGIYLVDQAGGKPVKLAIGTDRPLDAVFTPDAREIMFRSNDEGEWHLYVFGLNGARRKRITGQLSAASFCLSPRLY